MSFLSDINQNLLSSFLPYDAFKAILSYVLNVHDPNLKRNRPRKTAR